MTRAETPLVNRRGQTMFARLELPEGPRKGLALIEHGYSGSMDQPHIARIARTFRDHGFATLCLNATHAFNPSDGELEGNTIDTHLHDFEDCLAWARAQSWFGGPLALAGHSLGSYSVLRLAADNPAEVALIFPCSTVVSGALLAQAFERNMPPGTFAAWKAAGGQEITAWDGSGRKGVRPFSWLTGMKDHDILPAAHRLTMPVLLVAGSADIPTPPDHQRILLDALPGDRELHIVEGADHNFSSFEYRESMASILSDWLSRHGY